VSTRGPAGSGTGRVARVLTHRNPAETREAIGPLVARAEQAGYVLRFDAGEARKHGLSAREGVVRVDEGADDDVDLCVVLGGDGTILTALRRFARTGVPVFAVNFGEVGFLATLEPGEMDDGLTRAFAHEFERLSLPAVVIESGDDAHVAINDISIHRKVGERVALLAYAVEGFEVGAVRCDGLVVSTPAGSTGYNLANGGPVLAWGVEGFVVSFIAPHSLTARALVVAPEDRLEVLNRSHDGVDVTIDGRPIRSLEPGDVLTARFRHDASCLAQVPGSSFYRRLREKFGRLSY
jgi:NAD+ kinase